MTDPVRGFERDVFVSPSTCRRLRLIYNANGAHSLCSCKPCRYFHFVIDGAINQCDETPAR